MRFDTKASYNPAGVAKLKEVKRQVHNETEQRNQQIPAFMFQGFGFRPRYSATSGSLNIVGPLCPREDINKIPCLSRLVAKADLGVECDVCGFSSNLPKPFEQFTQTAHKKYEGHLHYKESGGRIETLDVPYHAIKAQDKDDTREIKIKWSQKDGRNMAVIYFIEKNDKGEKTQVMVDMDREELRYDATDIHPSKVLAQVSAVFPSAEVAINYKKDK